MNLIKKIISKIFGQSKDIPEANIIETSLDWIEAENNEWNVRVLDLRPYSQTLISVSENNEGAENALSYFNEDGSSFEREMPFVDMSFDVNIRIPITKELEEGALFIPQVMEHKWAIFYKAGKLIIVRGWERRVHIIANVEKRINELYISNIHGKILNEDEPEAFTKANLIFIIYSHVLGEIVPVPLPEELIDDTKVVGLWAFRNYGNMADFGCVGFDFNYQRK